MSAGELFPALQVYDMAWQLSHPQGVRMQRSGNSQVVQMVEPFWTFELQSTWLDADQFQTWESFLHRRKGSAVTFTAHRMDRQYGKVPVVNDTGLTITAVDRANSTVSFGSTGAWTANPGDPLSFYTAAGGYWYGEAQETKAAAGGAMTALAVWPPPFTQHASTANPRRIRALAEFFLSGMPTKTTRVDERRIAFAATQLIRG